MPYVASVGRHGGAHGLELLGLLAENLPRASIHMPQPEFHYAQPRLARTRHHVLAVWRPVWRHPHATRGLRDLGRVARRDLERPQVVVTASVRDEKHLRAIRTEARLTIEREAAGDPGCIPAPDGHGV